MMKVRVTIMTENDKERPADLTEKDVIKSWQLLFDLWGMAQRNPDKCVVETAEFVEDGDGDA